MQYTVDANVRGQHKTFEFDVPSTKRDPWGWCAMKAMAQVRPDKPNTIIAPYGETMGDSRVFGVFKTRFNQAPVNAKITITVMRLA